ncbi:LicD family-domain-containing protein [Jackrogersella minutella]|nr:LicD family-domain-containing protein [Jackrogersella minutella]
MPTATLTYLGLYFNRTLHDYQFLIKGDEDERGGNAGGVPVVRNGGSTTASVGYGTILPGQRASYVNKTYLLDINRHHTDLDRGNGANVIDARWIDVSNGLYIDITGLAERDPAASPGVWSCKNGHLYRTSELFPMRRTEFEGVPASVPFAFDKILTDEYGPRSLSNDQWLG